nr:CheR family methyltransferase [Acanthopleuribacter pedis]
MDISDAEFALFRDLIYKNFGIHLTDEKRSLLVRRLQQLLRINKFRNFGEYYDYLRTHPSDENFTELVNRITTNYTFFNREPDHFTFFTRHCLPEIRTQLIAQNSRDLRVWCAASSTGEEPYMLVMLMMEFFKNEYPMWDAGVLATDLSRQALTTAAQGRYKADQVDMLPKTFLLNYFLKQSEKEYEVNPRVKREVTYRRFNLINKVYPFRKPFDVIFCRNVMIYFDEATKAQVSDKLYESLKPGGYLFIGHSETLTRINNRFNYVKPAVYRKP